MIFYFLTQNAHADGAKAAGGKTPPARRRSAFEKADFFRSEKCLAAGGERGNACGCRGHGEAFPQRVFACQKKGERRRIGAALPFLLRQGRKKKARDCRAFFKL